MDLDLNALIKKTEILTVTSNYAKESSDEIKTMKEPEFEVDDEKVKKVKKEIADSENKIDEKVNEKIEKIKQTKNTSKVTSSNDNNYVCLYDILTKHNNKFDPSITIIKDEFPYQTIKHKKYLLIERIGSSELKNGEIILLEDCDKLKISQLDSNDKIEKIKIFKSGVIIFTKNKHIFITKTQTNEFEIDKEFKIKRIITIKKANGSITASVLNNNIPELKNVNELKSIIKKFAPSFYKSIDDITIISDIKKNLISFIKDINDVSYLIKIYNNILIRF